MFDFQQGGTILEKYLPILRNSPFYDGSVEFTLYLHLWKTGSVVKTYGNCKRYGLKIRN